MGWQDGLYLEREHEVTRHPTFFAIPTVIQPSFSTCMSTIPKINNRGHRNEGYLGAQGSITRLVGPAERLLDNYAPSGKHQPFFL